MKAYVKKIFISTLFFYVLLTSIFYMIAGDGFRYRFSNTQMVSPKSPTGVIVQGKELTQKFFSDVDQIRGISVVGGTFQRNNSDSLEVTISSSEEKVLGKTIFSTKELLDNSTWEINFEYPVKNVKNQILTLKIKSLHGRDNDGVAFYYGDSYDTGKFKVDAHYKNPLLVEGREVEGTLCLSVSGMKIFTLAKYYWLIVIIGAVLIILYFLWAIWRVRRERTPFCVRMIGTFRQYRFLLSQLIFRDFKTKYKRSILGMLWSFLNPLLTMLVLYIVFSTIFKSNIPNFSTYLLSGIVIWGFFAECTIMSLGAITGNAALITKVYVPKYMYPFSRAISSLVNFGFSLIPLLVVALITGIPVTKIFLLLPIPITLLFIFSLGMGLILCTAMVFFRDTQFLWGVLSSLWMYLTPIFYDPIIIPERFMGLYKMNPLYHLVRLFRIMLIDGVSPEPKAYILAGIAAVVPFIIGCLLFKKNQDRFVLYL